MYYGGIDLGTSSVGWALTDENYNLIHKKGKDLWGVRLFDEAKSAQERRMNRTSRRRRAREIARIGLVREYFSDEIEKIDSGFYQRLEESKYHREDKKAGEKFALFADPEFTDKEYYKKYPTIFHLRKELLESSEEHDVRLVYLAVLNLFKHRGHFLSDYLGEKEEYDTIFELYKRLCAVSGEELNLYFPDLEQGDRLEDILGDKDLSRSEKTEKLAEYLQIKKNQSKAEYELIKMICGLSGKLQVIFGDILGEEYGKKQLSFRDSSSEETIIGLADILSDGAMEIIKIGRKIHNDGLMVHLLKGHTYLSQARVESFKKHGEDLDRLKSVVKKYCREQYDSYFRIMGDDNYSGYVGTVNSGKEKERRNRKAKKESYKAFWSETKRLLNQMPQEDEDVIYLKRELEKETLLPKQRTFENGVIPNQVYLAELKKILSNAENYLPFLKEKDESGLTVEERIIKLFQFQIPYYVGPLYIREGEEGIKWVNRKEKGKVLPWNIEDKVDMAKTREAFITRMVRHCTYLEGKYVLPKNSLLYEKFMVLNELNSVRLRGDKLPITLKQHIYTDLFMSGKKVSGKKLFQYLIAEGILTDEEQDEITGIDGDFKQTLVSYGRFQSVLGDKIKNWETQKMAEQIIFWGTVYSNDKKLVKKLILENYGEQSEKKYLSEVQVKRILGFKWKDWGKLSKDFLEIEGCSKEDGVVMSLIQAMWETDSNLMELLSERYTFMDTLKEKTERQEKLLKEFTYKDLQDSYLSAPVRRMTWQTILICKELCQVMGETPKRLFVEMPREKGEKGKRTQSRKRKFEELYKKCKEDSRDWLSEINQLSEDNFRSKKLYLYYTQQGRCMYTGHPISLEDLMSNNSRYDIDHIYPRHYLKDDSLENNLVLVEKEVNNHKQDTFPIEVGIQGKQRGFWKHLADGGFISQEKYKRLTRTWDFSDEELAGFINRQIVETGQATKYVADLLGRLMPSTEIIYVKAKNVSDFRHKTDLLKSRVINDFHHAQDAYLNIVVGNTYYTKFTGNPINFIKAYQKDRSKNAYHMEKMFQYDVIRGSAVAWKAGEKGTIVTVKKMMARNTPLMTKRTYEAHGGIADQTIYSSKEANVEYYIPVQANNTRLSDVTKYGGYSSVSGAYYFLVEHEKKGKRIRTLEQMPIYLKDSLENDDEALKKYCCEKLKLDSPDIRLKKISRKALIKRNGYFINLGGKTGKQIVVDNAISLCLTRKWINYIKHLENAKETGRGEGYILKTQEGLSKEANVLLYQELLHKHRDTIYRMKPNPLFKKLEEKQEAFEKISFTEQINVLLELLKATQCLCLAIDAKEINIKSSSPTIGKEVSNQDEFLLINQSVTGLFLSVVDLKTV